MRSFLLTGTFAFVAAAGAGPQQASASTIPTVTLTDGAGEVTESFSAQTPEYQFNIPFAIGTPVYLDMAFSAASGEQYDIQFMPPDNGSLGGLPGSLSYTGPTSVSFELTPSMNAGFTQGVLQMDVTLTNAGADPLGAFEISGSPITLDVPTGTPIPSTFPLLATVIGCLGLLGWRKKKKTQLVAA